MSLRKITSDGVWRILWEKQPNGEWVEIRREKLRRTLN